MMSNCAFWSNSGELLAVHSGPGDARATFGAWASALRFPPGRLVSFASGSALPELGTGWQALPAAPRVRPGKPPRTVDASAPVAVAAPAYDEAARRLLPALVNHEKFTLRSAPTWVATVRLERDEGPEGWYAALLGTANRFLVRLVPHRGRLPGEGWRNMLAWSLREHAGVRLVPLNGLPRPDALAAAPAWEYRVEAGRGADSAAWDVQLLPTRALLSEWTPEASDPWEATARLRWLRSEPPEDVPLPGETRWADLFARWPVADARLVVQNLLSTLPGGAGAAAALLFDTITLSDGAGRTLVRHVPPLETPLALLSTLFGRRAWQEVERARRSGPSEGERALRRREALDRLDDRLATGHLVLSEAGADLWQRWYREPLHHAQERELAAARDGARWRAALEGDHRVLEALLRELDVTDAALCLRDVPDTRWRRYVTARREKELKDELEFCRTWDQRGELTVDRQLDAWREWDALIERLSLTGGTSQR